ncbi:MAG TPA: hypothetical protein VMM84_12065 [Pyrinomonadaceae bacterium]|nr:hypothetical protein [Pyrinomonadaceae bacterium]
MADLQITLPVVSILVLIIVLLSRRFRRTAADVSWPCHVAAAIAVTFGAVTLTAGVVHSVAVTSIALREPEYGPLQILRFTTGAMLMYSGAMNVALYGAIKVGRRSAIAVGAATCLLFVLYLIFLLPLPGGGGTVPPMLALWSLYLLSLGTAAIAVMRGTGGARRAFDPHA